MTVLHAEGVDAGTATLDISRAILLYENGHASLATVHGVAHLPGEKQPVLLPGICLTRELLDSLLRNLQGSVAHHEIVPENVLCADATRLAWWVKSQTRPIFFNTSDKDFNKEVDSRPVHYPALLFVAKPRVLSVFALARDERPDPKTRLFRAPFMNLYEQGNMCAGDTRLPDQVMVKDIPVWERAFFDTRFTHTNINAKLTSHAGGHSALWRAMVGAKSFPADALIPIKTTLQEAIDQ